MPRIRSKRQIVLPAEQRHEAIPPGDEYTSYITKQGDVDIQPLNNRNNRAGPSLKNETGSHRKISKSIKPHPK